MYAISNQLNDSPLGTDSRFLKKCTAGLVELAKHLSYLKSDKKTGKMSVPSEKTSSGNKESNSLQ